MTFTTTILTALVLAEGCLITLVKSSRTTHCATDFGSSSVIYLVSQYYSADNISHTIDLGDFSRILRAPGFEQLSNSR